MTARGRRIARGATLFAAAAAISNIFILNLCNAVFRCGCKSLWNGAAEMCNVHQAGVRHCPWCSYGETGFWLAMGLLLVPQFAFSFWPASMRFGYRIAVVFAMFPLAGSAVALAYGLHAGYWK